ncbi:hypothetical protein BKA64DRAFT_660857 [Cadophora sp. MPI-SDFR-AT-0126]|nr:hypothetical protein BKA64DRAFT_660857 [Leotiomycetes sp. MPI-SDFR-AT-0126]
MSFHARVPLILDNSILDYIPNWTPSSSHSGIRFQAGSPMLVAGELNIQLLEGMDLETRRYMTRSVSKNRAQSQLQTPRTQATATDGENGSTGSMSLKIYDDEEEMSLEEEVKMMMDAQVVSPPSSPSILTIQILPPTPPHSALPAQVATSHPGPRQGIPTSAYLSPDSAKRPRKDVRERRRDSSKPYPSRSANSSRSTNALTSRDKKTSKSSIASSPSTSNDSGVWGTSHRYPECRKLLVSLPGLRNHRRFFHH